LVPESAQLQNATADLLAKDWVLMGVWRFFFQQPLMDIIIKPAEGKTMHTLWHTKHCIHTRHRRNRCRSSQSQHMEANSYCLLHYNLLWLHCHDHPYAVTSLHLGLWYKWGESSAFCIKGRQTDLIQEFPSTTQDMHLDGMISLHWLLDNQKTHWKELYNRRFKQEEGILEKSSQHCFSHCSMLWFHFVKLQFVRPNPYFL
jgi:hypothetical protein